jgi:hypothetical protein
LNKANIIADCCRNSAINPPIMFPYLPYNVISRRVITDAAKTAVPFLIKNPVSTPYKYGPKLTVSVVESKVGTSKVIDNTNLFDEFVNS